MRLSSSTCILPDELRTFHNYAADPISSNNSDQFDVRVDHTFSEKDNIFGRFSL